MSVDAIRFYEQFPAAAPARDNCCVQRGFYWDDVILYPRASCWEDRPASAFRPVFRVLPTTGPLFLIAAILVLVGSLGIARVNVNLVWSLLFVGTGVAFWLEWRYAKRSASQGS